MKAVVVEGRYDYKVLMGLFPHVDRGIMLRHAHGFSSALSMMKTLIDYGYEVMAVFDTDSDKPETDNRKLMDRLYPNDFSGRSFKIVWMDACIEDVLERAVPGFKRGIRNDDMVETKAARFRSDILKLPEFQDIQSFVEGK